MLGELRSAAIALGEPKPWQRDSDAASPSSRQVLGAKPPTPRRGRARASVRRGGLKTTASPASSRARIPVRPSGERSDRGFGAVKLRR
jgi:hypothetical protein